MLNVEKVWGHEEIIINRQDYCMKKLVLDKGRQCSLHFHKKKDEVFFVHSGLVKMEVENVFKDMKPGESVRIKPYQKHRFYGIEDSIIVEASSHDDANDSYRLEESK